MKTIFLGNPTIYVFLLILRHVRLQDSQTTTEIDESTKITSSPVEESLSLNRFYRCLPKLRVNVIARCPAEYRDEKVISKCEKGLFPLDEEDISIIVPVTGLVSGIHYANQYCAQCHNDSSTNPWELNISWPTVFHFFDGAGKEKSNEEILSTLRYNETLGMYTVNVTDRPLPCTFTSIKPDNVHSIRCNTQVIWECPSTYEGVKDCKKFPGDFVCDWPNYIFGNAECARCNNFKLQSESSCDFMVMRSAKVQTLFKLRKSSNSNSCSIPAIAKYYCTRQ